MSGCGCCPGLERASKLVAKAGRVLVDQLDLIDQEGADLDVAAMWAAVAELTGAGKEQVRAALEVVQELVPESDGAAEAAMRAALVEKYNTVRPLLRLLGESKALATAPGGRRVLAAVRRLPELSRRQVSKKPLLPKEIDAALVIASWKRTVYANPDLAQGAVGPASGVLTFGIPGRGTAANARAASEFTARASNRARVQPPGVVATSPSTA